MNFEEFQHLARLSIVGALDHEELAQFEAGRLEYGQVAEAFLEECRKLNAVFALSLHPCEPDPRTKGRILDQIKRNEAAKRGKRLGPHHGDLVVGKLAPEWN